MSVLKCLLVAVSLQAIMLCTNVQAEDTVTEKEALKLLYDWREAYLTRSYQPLDQIMHDDWQYAGSAHGKTTNKIDAINGFKSADFDYTSITYDNLEVSIYGNTAVVRGTEELILVGHADKKETVVNLRFTDVYYKEDGVLRAIATHTSPIE